MYRIIQITLGTFVTDIKDMFEYLYPDSYIFISNSIKINPDILVLSGGADINPEIYGEENIACHYIDYNRDIEEMILLDKYVGIIPIYGICRGHQLILAHLYRCKLIQDIEPYHDSYHYVEGKNKFLVNSIHHQGVPVENVKEKNYILNTYQGIVEVFLDKINKVHSVQFHPELIYENLKEYIPILKGFIE